MPTRPAKPITRRRRERRGGFTLIEVTIAMIIFLFMVMMFAAVFPLAVRGALFSNNYSQAVALCQHKLDQMRDEGFTNMTNPSNVLYTSGVIDNPSGSQSSFPYTYYFTTTDSLTGYYPSGATGKIIVSQDSNVKSNDVDDVAITISWTTANGGKSSYTLYGMIIKNTAN